MHSNIAKVTLIEGEIGSKRTLIQWIRKGNAKMSADMAIVLIEAIELDNSFKYKNWKRVQIAIKFQCGILKWI
jgi:hypothetical protein